MIDEVGDDEDDNTVCVCVCVFASPKETVGQDIYQWISQAGQGAALVQTAVLSCQFAIPQVGETGIKSQCLRQALN